MHLDVALLSRIQFALTIMFHYIFPPLTIGLGGLLVSLEWKFLRTGDRQYEMAAKFWTKIFAIVFAIGVATGIMMEFQFGTNWATYSRYVGDVFGSALAAEGIFAFFLESGFLAVLVFGWDKVSPRMHFFAAVHGRARRDLLVDLDCGGQFLAANTGRFSHRATAARKSPISGRWCSIRPACHRLVHVLDRRVHRRRRFS